MCAICRMLEKKRAEDPSLPSRGEVKDARRRGKVVVKGGLEELLDHVNTITDGWKAGGKCKIEGEHHFFQYMLWLNLVAAGLTKFPEIMVDPELGEVLVVARKKALMHVVGSVGPEVISVLDELFSKEENPFGIRRRRPLSKVRTDDDS